MRHLVLHEVETVILDHVTVIVDIEGLRAVDSLRRTHKYRLERIAHILTISIIVQPCRFLDMIHRQISDQIHRVFGAVEKLVNL